MSYLRSKLEFLNILAKDVHIAQAYSWVIQTFLKMFVRHMVKKMQWKSNSETVSESIDNVSGNLSIKSSRGKSIWEHVVKVLLKYSFNADAAHWKLLT